jgi:hypothetical protein
VETDELLQRDDSKAVQRQRPSTAGARTVKWMWPGGGQEAPAGGRSAGAGSAGAGGEEGADEELQGVALDLNFVEDFLVLEDAAADDRVSGHRPSSPNSIPYDTCRPPSPMRGVAAAAPVSPCRRSMTFPSSLSPQTKSKRPASAAASANAAATPRFLSAASQKTFPAAERKAEGGVGGCGGGRGKALSVSVNGGTGLNMASSSPPSSSPPAAAAARFPSMEVESLRVNVSVAQGLFVQNARGAFFQDWEPAPPDVILVSLVSLEGLVTSFWSPSALNPKPCTPHPKS